MFYQLTAIVIANYWHEVHRVLLGKEIVIVETLTNLDQLPDELLFMGFPSSFKGCDGSPIRTVAMVD